MRRSSSRHGLDEAQLARALRTASLEGPAFALMVGLGEIYFLADAIRVSASRLEQGLIVALPLFLGSFGPLLVLRLLAKARSRKPVVLGAAACQASCLLLLAITAWSGTTTPTTLLATVCAYHFFGQAVGTAWASWFADLVPAERRGSWFSRRNRGIYLYSCIGLLLGGLLLEWLEPAEAAAADGSGGRGFALIYALAAAARLGSVALHLACPEGAFARPASRTRVSAFLRTRRGSTVWRLLLYTPALYLTVYLASPYFTPYMLDELGFSYLEFMAASLFIIAIKVIFVPAWGAAIENSGARPVLLLCAIVLALVPLPWMLAQGLALVLVAQGLSGMAWAGFELSAFCLLIENTPRAARPQVFASQAALNGVAQLLGGLLGVLLVTTVHEDLRVLFGVSLGLRLLLAVLLPRIVPAHPGQPGAGRREVLMRVIGFRPSGGLRMGPVTEGEGEGEEEAPR